MGVVSARAEGSPSSSLPGLRPGTGHFSRKREKAQVRPGAEMDTSRAQLNRVLDPEASNVTLETLSRAAKVLGRGLKVELV